MENMMNKTTNNAAEITTQMAPAIKAMDMHSYMHEYMSMDIAEFRSSGNIMSGYSNLDEITNLYPGLYVIGAISSLGKTTFIHQMADQMAKNGEHIIFFSMEQTTLELATKSLSRIMAQKYGENAMTSLQIRKAEIDERVEQAIAEYDAYSANVTVVECGFRSTIEDIENYVLDFIKEKEVKPIVIVDYLQIIQSKDGKLASKDAVDMHVKRLKDLQADNKLVMIVISSFNRANYMSEVSFESFKESGSIEYTADVIWGLQLSVLHNPILDNAYKINTKRGMIRLSKMEDPRKVELICLKSRSGSSGYICSFDYYAKYDWFKPIETVDNCNLLINNFSSKENEDNNRLSDEETTEFWYLRDDNVLDDEEIFT